MAAESGIRLALVSVLAGCLLAGCATPSSRENVAAVAAQVAVQTPAAFKWRRSAADDARVQADIAPLVDGGITGPEAIAIAFLASPDLQLQLERVEVSRAELVAAATLPNPALIVGSRAPGGNLAAFYAERTVNVGVLQNVLALLSGPSRRRIARSELLRARLDVADQIVALAAGVNEAYLEYVAARQIVSVRERSAAAATAALDTVIVNVANHKLNTPADLVLERNAVFGIQSALDRAKLDVASTRARLAQVMGLAGLRDDWQVTEVLPPLPAADPANDELEAQALRQRLDLRAAREAVATRLEALRTQQRFRWLGGLELGLFREGNSSAIHFTGPNAVVELPLFDQRQSQLLLADAQLRGALRTTESLVLAARTQLRTHQAELTATRSLVERYRDEVLPRQQWLLTYGFVTSDPGDLGRLHLRISNLAAEEQALGYLRDYWRARAALARAAGDWLGLVAWPAPLDVQHQDGAN